MIAGLVQAERATLSMSNGPYIASTLHTVILRCVWARVVMWGFEHKPKQDGNMICCRKRRLARVLRHDGGREGWWSSECIELMTGRSGGAGEACWTALVQELCEQDCLSDAG